ncbi:MAG: peptidase S10 [Pirellulaceae bacterium]
MNWLRLNNSLATGLLFFLCTFGLSMHAQEKVGSESEEKLEAKSDKKSEEDVASNTAYKVSTVIQTGTATIDGSTFEYQVETGTLTQTSDDGSEKAKVFFVAYTRPGSDEAARPVTFAFNGGPGSSSVWLHLGMLGPQRIVFPDDASYLRPPYQLEQNPHSLLDVTDLVFIDPVSTGFSRVVGEEKPSQFHGYNEDVRSVAQFIHDWTSHSSRWESPKFVLGESYGGLRAAGLAGYLQSRYNLELNGAVVISGAINFQTLRFGNGNDVPYICFLPTYAATAWYHQALSDELQALPVAEVVERAEELALGSYADVLLRGAAAKPGKVKKVTEQVSQLTGLSEDYLRRSNLRVSMSRFGKELLRERGKTIGRFDSRYTGIDSDAAGSNTEYDPSGAAIFGPFTATMNQYLREKLNYAQPRTYEILTGNVQPWNYDSFTGRYVDGSESLRSAMTANPHFQLYVACGYYDLATPHFAMEYTLNHLGLAESLRSNISISYFEGGHMMYIYGPAMQRLRQELVAWYAAADGVTAN